MQPFKFTVHGVFDRERRHVVPLFQRQYVWKESPQWEPLWSDIERQSRLALECKLHDKQFEGTHFLGAIVLRNSSIVGGAVAPSEIIDGQQRLTTLQIFLAALRDFAFDLDPKLSRDIDRLTTIERRNLKHDERFKLWPTNADRPAFITVMTAKSRESVRAEAEQNPSLILEAYLYFYDRIQEFADEKFDDIAPLPHQRQDRVEAIEAALHTSLQIVVIELEERDNPQVIFETLNGRGVPLLPSDLIRNLIFLQATAKKEDPEELYNKYWRNFDEDIADESEGRYWHEVVRQGRLADRPRIDLFLFHYLVMKVTDDFSRKTLKLADAIEADASSRDIYIGELYRQFQNWWEKQNLSTEELLSEIKAAGGEYKKLISPVGRDVIADFSKLVRAFDTSTVYPVLLYLFLLPKSECSSEQKILIVKDIESYLVRRFVCGLTTKNYNNLFSSLLREICSARHQKSDIAARARRYLLRQNGRSSIWPNDEEFLTGWLGNPIYANSKRERCETVLRALEKALRNQRNENIDFLDSLTIEHLLPRNPVDGVYPYPDEAVLPLSDGHTLETRRQLLLDTIGNLTLLTQVLNSSVGNGKFSDKIVELGKNSDLRLNAEFRQIIAEVSPGWSEVDILTRGRRLFEVAKRVWVHPGTDAVNEAQEWTLEELGL